MADLDPTIQPHTVQITRTLNAPREAVWKAWTEPESIKQWWGPNTFSCPFAKTDLRIGGKYLYAMQPPEGKTMWSGGTFMEISKPSRLSYTDSFMDEKGNIVEASEYGMPEDFARILYVTVTFEEASSGNTRMTLVHKEFPSEELVRDCTQGWNECLDKMEKLLAKKQN